MNLKEGMRRAGIPLLFLAALLCARCNSGQRTTAIAVPETDLFVVQLGGKFGYIDKTGRVVIRPQFDSAKPFLEGMAAVRVGDTAMDKTGRLMGKWGYIDKTGRLAVTPRFLSAEDFSDGLALTNTDIENYKSVYIDKKGTLAITPEQVFSGLNKSSRGSFMSSFHDGLALIEVWDGENSKDGYINTQGKIAITPQFYKSYDFNEGVAQVQVLEPGDILKTGLIDKSGRLVADPIVMCPPLFAGELQFSEGYAAAKKECFGGWGFIDKSGHFVMEPRFASATVFREDLAIVGFENAPGAPPNDARKFFSALQTFGDWGLDYPDLKYGYIHKSGTLVIPARFEGAGVFSARLAVWLSRLGSTRRTHFLAA